MASWLTSTGVTKQFVISTATWLANVSFGFYLKTEAEAGMGGRFSSASATAEAQEIETVSTNAPDNNNGVTLTDVG